MKHLLAIVIAFFVGNGWATERVQHPPTHPLSQTATGGNANAYGGSMSGDTSVYVLPAPIGGSNLPAGMCQRSQYTHKAFVWNFVSMAEGESHTDMECLSLLNRLEELKRQPLPKPVVEILTCPSPAKAKSVQAAKKAGACKS